VTYRFASPLAQFDLTLSAMTDADVRNLVLDYSLDILPILMNFERHRQLELPLDDVDPAVVERWLDDRLVEAVRTYLQLHQNANYLKGHLVTDPVAKVEFPKYAAGATLDWKGKTYYFVGEESRNEFAKENQIAL
jgi:YHS domain-containing protein